MRKGFTLVELLVVIGIIAVLIAMLLPALNSARDAARRSTCLANLRQVAVMLNMYTQENDGFFPAFKTSAKQNYANAIFTMLKKKDATLANVGDWGDPYARKTFFFCPTDAKPWAAKDYDTSYASAGYTNIVVAGSYGANDFLMPSYAKNKTTGLYEWSNLDPGPPANEGGGKKIGRRQTDKVFTVMDWHSNFNTNPTVLPQYLYNYKTSYGFKLDVLLVHKGGTHMAFADTHVEWLPGLRKTRDKPSDEIARLVRYSEW